ncbi:MAG: hypothetical protein HYY35_03805 [Deltaproteobacteria bacterium]|nr:hypothetical protein [Deltaproteobacteria bacterium]
MNVYLVPGAVFQSILIGGGYGTGREIVEYFTQFGMGGGAYGLSLATMALAGILALTFELARMSGTYDYRSFFITLIGRFWVAFEIVYVIGVLLVLAVLGAASGEIVGDITGLSARYGGTFMLVLVATLNFCGRNSVKRALTLWPVALCGVFALYVIAVYVSRGDSLVMRLGEFDVRSGWAASALTFSLYNAALGPIVLFATHSIQSRLQALASGCIAAFIGMIPAFMFHIALGAGYPDIVAESVPNYRLLEALHLPLLTLLFMVVLFGTFVETGAGLIQGINERIDSWLMQKRGRGAARFVHGIVSLIALVVSSMLAPLGIVPLVADGYGTLAWLFLAVYIIPLATIGLWRLATEADRRAFQSASPR